MPDTKLRDRALIEIAGAEARAFLDRLFTCDLDRVDVGRPAFGALLSPQGKILADFHIFQTGHETFLIDCAGACAVELIKRLTMYKLRAQVAVRNVSASFAVVTGATEDARPADALTFATDARRPELGWRAVRPAGFVPEASDTYEARRIAAGIPEGGIDFAYRDTFPHEALMDGFGGVDFAKGCYVGQEVVSRMQHRGTARTRIVRVVFAGRAPAAGTPILAGDRSLGVTASVAGRAGLAMIRIDRAADAWVAGLEIAAAGTALRFDKPGWVRFAYPNEMATSP